MIDDEMKRDLALVLENQSAGKGLDEILAIDDDDMFMLTIDHYVRPPEVPGYWRDNPPQSPEFRAVLVLNEFALEVNSGGVGQFLLDKLDAWNELIEICARVGAPRTLEYLGQVIKCFPEPRMPKDNDECNEWVLDEDVENCLDALDRKYEDCLGEIAQRLRGYVRENRIEFEKHD